MTRSVEGAIHETTYAEIRARALRLAQRLERDGIRLGDRVATLAWNSWRHLEAWYGIMGIGAVYHTVNPRLFPDQIVWIVNHAEDRVMLVDLTFIPLLEKLADKLPTIERYVVLTDAAHMPQTSLKNAVPYEEWIAEADGDFAWKTFDENTAAGMCYTSGTTGNPKGVLYSHRSNVLHGLMANTSDMKGYSSRDVVMPVVPMFHANCWAHGVRRSDCRRLSGHAGRQARRRVGVSNCSSATRSPAPPPYRQSGSCCCNTSRQPAASCPISGKSSSAAPRVRAPWPRHSRTSTASR